MHSVLPWWRSCIINFVLIRKLMTGQMVIFFFLQARIRCILNEYIVVYFLIPLVKLCCIHTHAHVLTLVHVLMCTYTYTAYAQLCPSSWNICWILKMMFRLQAALHRSGKWLWKFRIKLYTKFPNSWNVRRYGSVRRCNEMCLCVCS